MKQQHHLIVAEEMPTHPDDPDLFKCFIPRTKTWVYDYGIVTKFHASQAKFSEESILKKAHEGRSNVKVIVFFDYKGNVLYDCLQSIRNSI